MAERQLEAQRAREIATRKALVRARQVAAGSAVLAIVAIAGALFGWQQMTRARDAEAQAIMTRSEAEKLLVYLIDDFYIELAPVGRLQIIADLSKRALDYYAALPEAQRTAETRRNRALAQVRYGHTLVLLSKYDESEKTLAEAIDVLARLRSQGDSSEATAIGLGVGYAAKSRLRLFQSRGVEQITEAEQAAAVLEPLMAKGKPSIALLRAHGEVMSRLGFAQTRGGQEAAGAKALRRARDSYRAISGLGLEDLNAAAGYAEASTWLHEALVGMAQLDEARLVGKEAMDISSQVLERRPGHMGALRSHGLISGGMAQLLFQELQGRRSIELRRRAEQDWVAFLKLDPGNVNSQSNLLGARWSLAESRLVTGNPAEALATSRLAIREFPRETMTVSGVMAMSARLEAEMGLRHTADKKDSHLVFERTKGTVGPFIREWVRARIAETDRDIALANGDFEAVVASTASIRLLEAVKPSTEAESRTRHGTLSDGHRQIAIAAYHLKDYATAEKEIRLAVENVARIRAVTKLDNVAASEPRVWLGQILARSGRGNEAAAILAPQLKLHRDFLAGGSDNLYQHHLLARALLAQAIASPAERQASLAEAARIIDRMPAEMARLKTIARLRAEIAEESRRS